MLKTIVPGCLDHRRHAVFRSPWLYPLSCRWLRRVWRRWQRL